MTAVRRGGPPSPIAKALARVFYISANAAGRMSEIWMCLTGGEDFGRNGDLIFEGVRMPVRFCDAVVCRGRGVLWMFPGGTKGNGRLIGGQSAVKEEKR